MPLSRRKFLTATAALGASLTPLSAASAPLKLPQEYGVIGTVITGDNSRPRPNHAVLVREGLIQDVIPAQRITDRKTISSPGTFIMPGVINCHVHRIHSPHERYDRYLQHGVTSIGDVASPLTALTELLVSPNGITATSSCTGPMLCPPGGYPLPIHSPEHGMIVTSPHHGRERVRQLADLGVTMIKLAFEPGPYPDPWPTFDAATAESICNEARKYDLIIRCHVEDLSGLEIALNAGVHTIEHVPHRWIGKGSMHDVLEKNGEQRIPISAYRRLLKRMVREEVILTPTLDVLSRSIWHGPELSIPVRYFAQAGGQIAVGNDHPYRRTDAGMPMKELHLLSKAGLDNHTIISSATGNSAATCGLTNRGTLTRGKAADMLILAGDPTVTLNHLSTPIHIIKDGILIK